MNGTSIHAVTGAYGYSGKYIAQRLLDEGRTVITLTNSVSRVNPFGNQIKSFPFDFDQPSLLAEHLQGVSVLYNTYWVRFNHRLFKHADAVRNTLAIAWVLRHLPVFGVFGSGDYRLQPIYVDDLAALAVEQGKVRDNAVINAIGPETFTYRELATRIGQLIGRPRRMVSVSPWFGHFVGRIVGTLVGDVVITKDEIEGLMADLLYVDTPPTGTTVLTEWVKKHADTLGQSYTSELERRRDRTSVYRSN